MFVAPTVAPEFVAPEFVARSGTVQTAKLRRLLIVLLQRRQPRCAMIRVSLRTEQCDPEMRTTADMPTRDAASCVHAAIA